MTPRGVRVGVVTGALSVSLLAAVTSTTEAAVYTPSNTTTFTMTSLTFGPATPGSTIIKIYGTATTISDVNVTLNSVAHNNPDDLDILLVGPDGTAVPLVSDVCGSSASGSITLDDEAAAAAPDAGPCPPGSYKPNNVGSGDTWDITPTGSTLAAFDTKVANGSWTLWVRDDTAPGGTGTIGGWSLTITTAANAAMAIPGPTSTVGDGVANPYPLPITVTSCQKAV